MKQLLLFTFVIAVSCNSSQKLTKKNKEANPVTYANTITEQELSEHLYTYASDEFQGRDTGSEGEEKAIEYLRSYYISHGISAAQAKNNYYQNVPLEKAQVPTGTVKINDKTFTIGEDVISFNAPYNNNITFTSIIVAGYGIESENYSDYTNLDVKNKVIFIKGGEPEKNENGIYPVSGDAEASVWSYPQNIQRKIELAKEKGAKGVLFYDSKMYPFIKQQFDYMKNNPNNKISLKDNSDFFYLLINENVVKAIYKNNEIENLPPTQTTNIQIVLKNTTEALTGKNVIAYIKGSEKPDEYIVISAHLDHVGIDDDGNVFNGADDDGSGTVAILEIAEAFKKAQDEGNSPKRSVVFLHVTGEEKGLFGSKYYTDQAPIFPLANTVANLNIDMIGRIDPKREGNRNYIYLIGSDKLSTELHNVSEEINTKYTQLELDYTYNDENDPNRFYYRSDHYNFAKNNIPVIFYFNGTHEDYHKITDTPDKINYDLLTNRAKLIFHTAWELANREKRVVVDKAVTN